MGLAVHSGCACKHDVARADDNTIGSAPEIYLG
jgi:hypothetical protein